jgi:predicted PurR-regulated permease PerM
MHEPSLPVATVMQQAPDPATPVPRRPATETICLLILTTLALLYTLSVAAEIVIPLLLAGMLKLLLQPAMGFLRDVLRLPLPLAALILILALMILLTGLGVAIAVPAAGWLAKAPEGLAKLEDRLSLLRGPLSAMQYMIGRAESLAGLGHPAAGGAAPDIAGVILSILLGTQHVFSRLLVTVVTLFFMLSASDSMLRAMVEVIPNFEAKRHLVHIANEVGRNVSSYLATITAINATLAFVSGLALWACGMSDPLLWGTMVFVLNYVPIIGPVTGVIVLLAVALLSFGDPVRALLPPAVYLALHVTESQVVTPHLLARRFTLSPLLVIVSLFFWNWLWGVPGALLSVPLLATMKIVCDRIPCLAPLGHLLEAAPRKRGA